jgi:hypothetical protein
MQENKDGMIDIIDGRYLGTKTIANKLIDLEDLMGSTYLELNTKSYGLYIPADELLKRNKYNWFCRLNTKEVLEANTNLSKYLIITNQMKNN